jgi:hypothetical protein
LAPHLLPSVLQLPAAIAAHMPPAQLPEQQAASSEQAVPSGVQAAPQLPPTHERPQHCTDEVQAPPLATQLPLGPTPVPGPVTQVLEAVSHVPTQQSPLAVQASPGAAHMPPPLLMSLLPLPLL